MTPRAVPAAMPPAECDLLRLVPARWRPTCGRSVPHPLPPPPPKSSRLQHRPGRRPPRRKPPAPRRRSPRWPPSAVGPASRKRGATRTRLLVPPCERHGEARSRERLPKRGRSSEHSDGRRKNLPSRNLSRKGYGLYIPQSTCSYIDICRPDRIYKYKRNNRGAPPRPLCDT